MLIFLFLSTTFLAQEILEIHPEDKHLSKVIKDFISNGSGTKVIHLKNGVYHLDKSIDLRSGVSLIGENLDSTILIFDLGGKDNCINIVGKAEKAILKLSLEYNNSLNSYEYYKIFSPAVSGLGLSEWGKESKGKLVKGIKGDGVLFLSDRLSDMEIQILGDSVSGYRLYPIEDVEISNLSLIRKDQTDQQSSNVFIKYAVNCKVSNVKSENCNYSHITIENSLNVNVHYSVFRKGFSNGNGGKAYGITLQYNSTSCNVKGCVFDSLRHGIVLQLGANLNLIRENYFINGFWEDVRLPKKAAGDIVLHGNYPFMNLIEGNICNNIVIDNTHGLNGPFNIIQANRTELYGIYMNKRAVHQMIFVFDNLIIKTLFKKGLKFNKNPYESCGNKINDKECRDLGGCQHVSTEKELIVKMQNRTNDAIEYFGYVNAEN